MNILRRIAAALQELDDHARSLRHVYIEAAPGVAPVWVAYMVVLLKWPDTELPSKLVFGFEIAGGIAPAHIYRPIEAKQIGGRVELHPQEELL